jgi:type II secretory pathway predicted ATPase ExeA
LPRKIERVLTLTDLGFAEDPFTTSADQRFFYLSNQNGKVMPGVQDIIDLRRGIAVIEGDYGYGKSSIALRLQWYYSNEEPDCYVYYRHTFAFESEMAALKDICEFFKLPKKRTKDELWAVFEDFISKASKAKKNIVLLLDDAQEMKGDTLNLIHKLYNFDPGGGKSVTTVLFGMPQLKNIFAKRPEVLSRVDSWFVLNPLSLEETYELIRFRTTVAGRKEPLLTKTSYGAIWQASQGVPRYIVGICSKLIDVLGDKRRTTAEFEDVKEAVDRYKEVQASEIARIKGDQTPKAKKGKQKSETGVDVAHQEPLMLGVDSSESPAQIPQTGNGD